MSLKFDSKHNAEHISVTPDAIRFSKDESWSRRESGGPTNAPTSSPDYGDDSKGEKRDPDSISQFTTFTSATGISVPEFARDKEIVDWDGPDDPKNPKNWAMWRKIVATAIISLNTTALYMGAAVVTAAEHELMDLFNTTQTKVALGITLFVWGYGIGCLWFTPMSEIPIFRGRNPTYFSTQFVYMILQIPTALVNDLPSYAVLRFLAGIFASPPLATAGATIKDMWDMPQGFFALLMWEFGTSSGPFVGPLVGAALLNGNTFRTIFWSMFAISGGFLVLMVFLFPETSEQELLIRKARRLRKETKSDKYIAPGEIIMKSQSAKEVLIDMFYRPIKLTIMEPVVLLMDVHIGLVYSVMYLYLEALPIVYLGTYGFTLVQMGAAFLSFLIGEAVAGLVYIFYVYRQVEEMPPERLFGRIAVAGALCLPTGLLIWGWLAREDIHWAIGMIGNVIYGMCSFFMFQSYFAFLTVMFPPQTVGSAFASNNIVRSLMGGAFPLFGNALYNNLATDRYPVGWGCTILAFAGIAMLPLPVFLYLRGGKLREYAQRKYGDKLMR